MKKLLLLLAAFFMLSFSVFGQEAAIEKIIQLGTTDNRTTEHLDILTNRFGGRMVGSAAYEHAAEWIIHSLRKWGVTARLEEAGTVPVGFNRGPWFGRMLGGDVAMNLHFVTPSFTSGTKGEQKGHVALEPKTQEEFDRMKGFLKGAWVLVSGKSGGWAIGTSQEDDQRRAQIIRENNEIAAKNRENALKNRQSGTNEPLLELKEEPGLFYRQMVDAGILGIIQSAKVPLQALYDRNVVRNPEMTFDDLPTVPDIKLDENQFAVVERMVRERRPFELEFDIRNHFRMGPVKYYNVVGEITGTEFPDEYVIVSCHLDAYDVATGGVDCGVGVTPAMEAARLIALSGAKPKRTILFCFFAAEEIGLVGSTRWVNTHPEKLAKIANLFNRDGGPTVPVSISVPQAMYQDFVTICEPVSRINPDFPFEVKVSGPRRKPAAAGGTDASVFAMEGVPTLGFSLGDPKGYNFNYGEIWHTERDLFNKSIPEYQEHTSVVTAIVALGVANLDHQLSREGLYE